MFQHLKTVVSGAQILFVAFGALVLVPLLTGLNPAMALLGAGVGTLLFQLCTGRQVPIFLGSSFAFIAPIIYATQTWGLPGTMFGLFAAGHLAGRVLYSERRSLLPQPPGDSRFLWLGRHTLAIYLLHQPLLVALLTLLHK